MGRTDSKPARLHVHTFDFHLPTTNFVLRSATPIALLTAGAADPVIENPVVAVVVGTETRLESASISRKPFRAESRNDSQERPGRCDECNTDSSKAQFSQLHGGRPPHSCFSQQLAGFTSPSLRRMPAPWSRIRLEKSVFGSKCRLFARRLPQIPRLELWLWILSKAHVHVFDGTSILFSVCFTQLAWPFHVLMQLSCKGKRCDLCVSACLRHSNQREM